MYIDEFLSEYRDEEAHFTYIQKLIESNVTHGLGYGKREHEGRKLKGIERGERHTQLHAHLGELDSRIKKLSVIERLALEMNIEVFINLTNRYSHPSFENYKALNLPSNTSLKNPKKYD